MLCIFIDALKPEYLKEMPFINSIKGKCLNGYLEVPLGYTGIIASFVTGLWPDKHKIFDLFVPDSKIKKKIKNKYLNALIKLLQNKRLFYTPLISKNDYFKSSIDKNWAQQGCLKRETIFNILREENKSFEIIDWPNYFKNNKARIIFSKSYKKSLALTEKAEADFIFVHFLDLEIAHKYGTESEEIKNALKNIDNAVKELYNKDKDVLIFSDHGMDDIEKEFDIEKEIGKLGLRFGEDFLYIIGSTTAEFWFYNKEAEKKVREMISKLNCGGIAEQKKFHLATESLIFLADFKTAFYPNFFSKEHFKAMHGWDPRKQKTYYILKNHYGKKGRKDVKIVDFFPTILKIMNLPYVKNDGSSLI